MADIDKLVDKIPDEDEKIRARKGMADIRAARAKSKSCSGEPG